MLMMHQTIDHVENESVKETTGFAINRTVKNIMNVRKNYLSKHIVVGFKRIQAITHPPKGRATENFGNWHRSWEPRTTT